MGSSEKAGVAHATSVLEQTRTRQAMLASRCKVCYAATIASSKAIVVLFILPSSAPASPKPNLARPSALGTLIAEKCGLQGCGVGGPISYTHLNLNPLASALPAWQCRTDLFSLRLRKMSQSCLALSPPSRYSFPKLLLEPSAGGKSVTAGESSASCPSCFMMLVAVAIMPEASPAFAGTLLHMPKGERACLPKGIRKRSPFHVKKACQLKKLKQDHRVMAASTSPARDS